MMPGFTSFSCHTCQSPARVQGRSSLCLSSLSVRRALIILSLNDSRVPRQTWLCCRPNSRSSFGISPSSGQSRQRSGSPANIAEGYKKLSRADKLRFYNIAQGSLEECRYYIILSKDLGYINEDGYKILATTIEECSKTLNAYCKGVVDNNFGNEL